MMSTFGASTPFILLARAHVKPEFKEQHMEAAAVADSCVFTPSRIWIVPLMPAGYDWIGLDWTQAQLWSGIPCLFSM